MNDLILILAVMEDHEYTHFILPFFLQVGLISQLTPLQFQFQDKSFKGYKEQRIWLEEFKEALTAPEPVWDLGASARVMRKTGRRFENHLRIFNMKQWGLDLWKNMGVWIRCLNQCSLGGSRNGSRSDLFHTCFKNCGRKSERHCAS